MEALLKSSASRRACCQTAYRVFKRCFDFSPLPDSGPYVRQRLHPDWKQMDNRIRRMENRISDFRIMCNDVRINKNRLQDGDSSIPAFRLEEIIKDGEKKVAQERTAIFSELQKLTATFVEGATREYVALRKFFLQYLYHTMRFAFQSLSDAEFDKLLSESPEGVTFEAPNRGTVTFAPHLCKKILASKTFFVNTAGVETTPIAIGLAILQAPPLKHCGKPHCTREDCIAVKSDYEQLFEAFFKETPRSLGIQKSRSEMSAAFDVLLQFPTKEVKREPEPEPIKQQASLNISDY